MALKGIGGPLPNFRAGLNRARALAQKSFAWLLLKPHLAVLAIVVAAAVTRALRIGDPAIQMDEQFYLLVGDRMWHGALPYVDIWDRKPIGLFLIYAALRPFSPEGIVAYQIGAFASVIATALVIRRIGQYFGTDVGATTAAICYIFFIPLFGGSGGQAPIFYNLPMALAALYVIRATQSRDKQDFFYFCRAAMLLSGLTLQIKYTAIFEGIFFGIWLLIQQWQRSASITSLFIFAAILSFFAIIPTSLAAFFYILLGHFNEFFYANFISIFKTMPAPPSLTHAYLIGTIFFIAPLITLAVLSTTIKIRPLKDHMHWFPIGWSAFAITGYFALGNNYYHYALPVIAPLTILCVPLFNGIVAYCGIVTAIVWYSVLTGPSIFKIRSVHQERIAKMASVIKPYSDKGCIYVNDGPVILYLFTKSCLPTPYIFPEHLNNFEENSATNANIQIKKLIKNSPAVIVVADKHLEHPRNIYTSSIIDHIISKRYHEIGRFPDIFYGRKQVIYVRNDLK